MSSAATPSILPTSLEAVSLREALARHRESLEGRLEAGHDGVDLGRANARFLNSCFRLLFEGAVRRAGLPNGAALAAVGSFGRGAVALRSDADVVLVVDAQALDAKQAGAIAGALLYPLWDAGFAVGHQVLSDADAIPLAETDLATATALLDMRPLSGDEALLLRLIARSNERLFGAHAIGMFFDRLEGEAKARHGRFGDSIYLLEPDIKNGEGALRDLDGARWAARARYRVGHDTGRDPLGVWGELTRLGVLLAREARWLAEAEEFLWQVRNRLHRRAGRKSDRLGFAEQEALASSMGFGADGARSVERLMQTFYLHAGRIARTRTSMLERMRPAQSRTRPPVRVDLGDGVLLFDGQVTIAGQIELERDPGLAMRAFAACAHHRAKLLPFARDSISRATYDPGWCERLRADRDAMALFVDLLCVVPPVPTRRGSMLGELCDTGLLFAVVPEFLPVVGRVHHDIYHVYTVDVHSVKAVDRVRELCQGALAVQFPLASRLAAELANPRSLFVAVLLHDIGKGWPELGGPLQDHSIAGAELCDRILPRLGITGEEAEETRRLVLDHLVMYRVATRRDLEDGSAVARFARGFADARP